MASSINKRTMKRDIGNKSEHPGTGVPSSRPSSGSSSVSSKTSTSKSNSHKPKGPSKEELKKANEDLYKDVEKLNGENQILKATITSLIDKLIENSKVKGVDIPEELYTADVCEIPSNTLVDLTEQLTAEEPKSHTVEGRIEELETRITHLNMELAKLLRTRLSVENGLDDLLESSNFETAKLKAKELIIEIRSSDLFTFVDTVPRVEKASPDTRTEINKGLQPEIKQAVPPSQIKNLQTQMVVNGLTEELDLTPGFPLLSWIIRRNWKQKPADLDLHCFQERLYRDRAGQSIDINFPVKKFPGDTHIKKMHKDLRQYVIQQLSLQKANGADWRMFGERIGIPSETLYQWKRWKLDYPMFYVLQSWSQSPGATVRLLHRHLVSPQMRNTLLAKRLSDFYCVD